MSFLRDVGRWLSSSEEDGNHPWPGRDHIPTEPMRDWCIVDCWFHPSRELVEAHYKTFLDWAFAHEPASIPYLSWAASTRLRVDLSCLKAVPTHQILGAFRDSRDAFYTLGFSYARNEHPDVEQYQTAWLRSEEYEALNLMAGKTSGTWYFPGNRVTPDWYQAMIVKTVASRWIGYHGFEERSSIAS
jgi:hypothetical protein